MKPYISKAVYAGLYALLGLFHVLIDGAKNLPILNSKRQQIFNPLRGKATTVELLYSPLKAIKMLTHIDQRMFKLLLNQLVNEYKLRPQECISAEQKLMIFMAIYGGGLSIRIAKWKFQHLTYTISL